MGSIVWRDNDRGRRFHLYPTIHSITRTSTTPTLRFSRRTNASLEEQTVGAGLPVLIITVRSCLSKDKMDDFVSESDSDYTSYWRDWVSHFFTPTRAAAAVSSSSPSCATTTSNISGAPFAPCGRGCACRYRPMTAPAAQP